MSATTGSLTAKQEAFCREYLRCGNANAAYRHAYNAENMRDKQIWEETCKLKASPKVSQRISLHQLGRLARGHVGIMNRPEEEGGQAENRASNMHGFRSFGGRHRNQWVSAAYLIWMMKTSFGVGRRMSALGQKQTSRALGIYVRFWGLSGHSKVTVGTSPPMSAFGGKADVRELPAVCPLIARSGHSRVFPPA